MAALSPFDKVIQGLEQDHNLLRIKKLMVYACRNLWENDPHQLAGFQLRELVQDFMAIAPTLDQFKDRLDKVVQTINKRAEYALIANAIINHLTPLYSNQQPSEPSELDGHRYVKVAQVLEQDPDHIRIKKLLFCACKHVWENDPAKLNYFSSVSLVRELYSLTPSPESLDSVLRSIVKTLNRQDIYRAIAEKISNAFQMLYTEQHEPETHIVMASAVPAAATFNDTQAHPGALVAALSDISQPVSEPQADSQPAPNFPESNTLNRLLENRKPFDEFVSDLFNLRLEIIKYTNPLRAKLLIFALLHSLPQLDSQPWGLVKEYDLDDLLRRMFQSYRIFTYLEVELKAIPAKFPDAHHYSQAASALLRLLKPIYQGGVEDLSLTPEEFAASTARKPKKTKRKTSVSSPDPINLQPIEDSKGQATCQFPTTRSQSIVSAPDISTPDSSSPESKEAKTLFLPETLLQKTGQNQVHSSDDYTIPLSP